MQEIHRARYRSSCRIVPSQLAGQSPIRRERGADPVPNETRVRSRVVDIRKDLNIQRTFIQVSAEHAGLG